MERLMQVIRRDREDEMDREEEMEISDKGSSKTPVAVEEGAVNRPDGGHHHEPIYGGRFSTAWWLEMAMSYMFDVEKELVPGLQSKSPVVRHAICSAHASLRLARDSAFRAMGELSVAAPPPSPFPPMAKLLTKSGRQNINSKKHAGHARAEFDVGSVLRVEYVDSPGHMFVGLVAPCAGKHCAD
ncbi:hypothetical protein R1sor_024770 [Riccia sorocarpa]|uniref:Uncharacterized protein n=1 Tax=Riccia sorocarpa TaxID=122646 RepID=A0ABD3GXH3_9MARC